MADEAKPRARLDVEIDIFQRVGLDDVMAIALDSAADLAQERVADRAPLGIVEWEFDVSVLELDRRHKGGLQPENDAMAETHHAIGPHGPHEHRDDNGLNIQVRIRQMVEDRLAEQVDEHGEGIVIEQLLQLVAEHHRPPYDRRQKEGDRHEVADDHGHVAELGAEQADDEADGSAGKRR